MIKRIGLYYNFLGRRTTSFQRAKAISMCAEVMQSDQLTYSPVVVQSDFRTAK